MAKCPKCGNENPGYVFYCGRCGSEIPEDLRKATLEKEKEDSQTASPPTTSSDSSAPSVRRSPGPARITYCRNCGADYDSDMNECPACGKSLEEQLAHLTYSMDGSHSSTGATGGLFAGGILALVAGVLALGQGLIYAAGGSAFSYAPGSGLLCLCGAIDILFGLGSMAGGYFAIKREKFTLALLGAVVGMLGMGFLIGFVLGLIALVLIATSKGEFNS